MATGVLGENEKVYTYRKEVMGKDTWEQKKNGKAASSGGQKPSSTRSGITSFKFGPTELVEVEEEGFGITDALKVLELGCVAKGLKFTIGVPLDRPGCYCVIRDGAAKYGEGLAISCWAKSPENAIIAAGWYLSHINPDYPDFREGSVIDELVF